MNRVIQNFCNCCSEEYCYKCHSSFAKLFSDLAKVLARHNVEIRVPLNEKYISLWFNHVGTGINFDIDEGITQDTLREKYDMIHVTY